MSVAVLTRFMAESRSELGARLVGIVLADAAWSDGITWIPQETIAARTNLSESTVRRGIRALEELGELETRSAQRGRVRVNVYRLAFGEVPQYERLPFELDDPFTDDRSYRPAVILPATTGQSDADDRSSSPETPPIENVRERKGTGPVAPGKVDRKTVTTGESDLSLRILEAWNAQAGTSFTSSDWLVPIIGRIREHPLLELADHEAVIAEALRERWWTGPDAPNVVYGNGAQFERSLEASRARADDRERHYARMSDFLARASSR